MDMAGSSPPASEFARDIDTDGSSESGCPGKGSESGIGGMLGWREGGTSGATGSETGTGWLPLVLLLFKFLALAL
jgi:hypothetical protein